MKKFTLNISAGANNPVPIEDVVRVLKGFQDMVTDFALMKANIQKGAGRYKDDLKETTQVVITGVRESSVEVDVAPKEQDIDMFGVNHFPLQVFDSATKTMESICNRDMDAIKKEIPDVSQRRRILPKINRWLPSKSGSIKATYKTGRKKAAPLQALNRTMMSELLEEKDIQKKVIHTVLAEIKGIATVDENGIFQNVQKLISMEEINALHIDKIAGSKYEYTFEPALLFKIEEEDGNRLIHQDDIGLITHATEEEDLMEAIGIEIDFLYAEYVEENDDNLHETGLELKKNLKAAILHRGIRG